VQREAGGGILRFTTTSPPQCITDSLRSRGYNSSQDLPSLVLDFVKLHPLMARPVVPTRGRPLLLKRNVRYTHLTGTQVTTPAGPTYDLLFLGTGASDPNP
jgi:plexin B